MSIFKGSLIKSPIPYISLLLLVLSISSSEARRDKLSTCYYSSTCPKALVIVEEGVVEAIKEETRMGASLLRLHFHDCFVNGCDGSVLLDDNATFTGEKTAFPNAGSIRGFGVVDRIKAKLEQVCPGVVSCADLLTLAARYAVYHLGGPSWEVKLGRRDSLTANRTAANIFIPAPVSNLTTLTANFAAVGLSFKDMVALSGAHTIGFAECRTFRSRIYNGQSINPSYAKFLQSKCPQSGNDNVLQGLDLKTPSHFDNLYYKNLLVQKGLLRSDQELFNGNKADYLVRRYSRDTSQFYKKFVKSMIKMGDISPLTGTQGEVRLNCRRAN